MALHGLAGAGTQHISLSFFLEIGGRGGGKQAKELNVLQSGSSEGMRSEEARVVCVVCLGVFCCLRGITPMACDGVLSNSAVA